MKVIDLLNKIANGEEVPEKIRVYDIDYTYDYEVDYKNRNGGFLMGNAICINDVALNEEVEIIEDTNKIHKLNKTRCIGNGTENETKLFRYCYDLEKKLGEVIDAVNKLKNTKK